MPRDVILTQEGLDKLKNELEYLSQEKRREVAERIRVAGAGRRCRGNACRCEKHKPQEASRQVSQDVSGH